MNVDVLVGVMVIVGLRVGVLVKIVPVWVTVGVLEIEPLPVRASVPPLTTVFPV